MNIPSISTARLDMRPFTMDDAGVLFDIQNDSEVVRYFPNPNPPPFKKVIEIIAQQLEHWRQHGYGWWALQSRDCKEFIGWAGLQFLPETGESEVAYLLGRNFWGKGLATEAARASLRFGFERTPVESFIGIVHLDNFASQKVLTHIGMTLVDKTCYFGMDCFRYCVNRGSFHPTNEPFIMREGY